MKNNKTNYRLSFLYGCIFLSIACTRKPMHGVTAPVAIPVDTAYVLRVLTYNIHHANPPLRPGVIDVDAIANVIRQEQPDIVALQEIDVNTDRAGKNLHEANELARLTGMQAYFAKSIHYDGGEYGNAILSKLPMERMKCTPLPTDESTKGEPRTLGTAVVTLPNSNKILFAFTHLDAQNKSANRLLQIKKITEMLQLEKLPVIIAGDFNATPGNEVINILDSSFTRTCNTNCGFTVAAAYPYKTIDFIAYKPASSFKVLDHKVINEKYASDHLPVLAVFQLKK